MGLGKSKKWIKNDRLQIEIGDNDIFVKCITDGSGNPKFHNKLYSGEELIAVIGEVERENPLSLKNREVWTCIFNQVGQPTSLSTANKNATVTLVIRSKSFASPGQEAESTD